MNDGLGSDGSLESRTGFWGAMASLFASSSTLVCCALPALLVAVGAGATLSTLVSAVPQLVWLSENKAALFVVAGALLVASGAWHWVSRNAPCPVDPALRNACLKTRRLSRVLFAFSVAIYLVGGLFAFVLPALDA